MVLALVLALVQADPAREALNLAIESLASGHVNDALLAFEEIERDHPETPAARAAPELAKLALAWRDGPAQDLPRSDGTTPGTKYEFALALVSHGRPLDALKVLHTLRRDHPQSPEAELAAALSALCGELMKRDRRAPEGAKLPPDARGCLFGL